MRKKERLYQQVNVLYLTPNVNLHIHITIFLTVTKKKDIKYRKSLDLAYIFNTFQQS